MAGEQEENPVSLTTGWRIDKRIPVAVILTLAMQSAAVLIWGVRIDSRVSSLETTTVSRETFARFDEKMNGLQQAILDMKNDVREVKTDINRLTIRGKP